MKPPRPSNFRLAAAAALALLMLSTLLALGAARPSEAFAPEPQFTLNPNFNNFNLLLATATPRPFFEPFPGGVEIQPFPPLVNLPTALPTPIPTPAPCGQAIALGKTVTGKLAGNGQVCLYPFRGTAGQAVTITMRRTAGLIDPLLELRSPIGARLAVDDDGDGRSNSAIRGFMLPESGSYTVAARSLDPSAAGSFKLNIASSRPVQPSETSPLPGAEEVFCTDFLRYGQSVEGQIPFAGAQCWYTFAGRRGDLVAVDVASLDGGATPAALAFDPSGELVPVDQAMAEGSALALAGLQLPVDGLYTVAVFNPDDNETGPFALTLLRQQPCKDAITAYTPQRALITPDSPVCTFALLDHSVLSPRVQVRTVSGDVQPWVQFYGPAGELLGEYVSDGTAQQAPPNTWTVAVQGVDGGAGIVEVQVKFGEFLISDQFCGGDIQSGAFVRGETLDFLPSCSYDFDGEAGDVVTIRMTRRTGADNQLDTFLTLLDPDDVLEIADDDSGLPPTNSLIREYELQSTGQYTIVAGAYNDATNGPFYLTFWQRSP